MNRLESGYRLYIQGKCSLIFEDDEEIQPKLRWIYRLSCGKLDGTVVTCPRHSQSI